MSASDIEITRTSARYLADRGREATTSSTLHHDDENMVTPAENTAEGALQESVDSRERNTIHEMILQRFGRSLNRAVGQHTSNHI